MATRLTTTPFQEWIGANFLKDSMGRPLAPEKYEITKMLRNKENWFFTVKRTLGSNTFEDRVSVSMSGTEVLVIDDGSSRALPLRESIKETIFGCGAAPEGLRRSEFSFRMPFDGNTRLRVLMTNLYESILMGCETKHDFRVRAKHGENIPISYPAIRTAPYMERAGAVSFEMNIAHLGSEARLCLKAGIGIRTINCVVKGGEAKNLERLFALLKGAADRVTKNGIQLAAHNYLTRASRQEQDFQLTSLPMSGMVAGHH